jgi:sugar phosphate isomerase/epimerase
MERLWGNRLSRRDLLKTVPGGIALSMAGTLSGGEAFAQTTPYPPALGVQLYTVRSQLGPATEATLKTIAEIGYKEVETTADALATVSPLLKTLGLTAPSGHFDYNAIVNAAKSDGFAKSVTQASQLGMKYYVIAYILANQRKTLDDYRQIADHLNAAARKVRDAGLQFCYHHHSFEFDPLPAEGGRTERGWDVFMARLDKDLVAFEVDVFWLATAGLDPAKTIRDLGARVKLLHLKDRAKDAPETFNEGKVPPTAFKEVGGGTLDFAAILKAAREVGVDRFFVEQDATPGDPTTSLRQSFQYLKTVRV